MGIFRAWITGRTDFLIAHELMNTHYASVQPSDEEISGFFQLLLPSNPHLKSIAQALNKNSLLAKSRHPRVQDTPLHIAFQKEHKPLVRLLLRHNADLHAIAPSGASVRDEAAAHGLLDFFESLEKHRYVPLLA